MTTGYTGVNPSPQTSINNELLTMSQHAFYSPSSAHRWINCPGSMAFAENHISESSTFADDGTASHEWAAYCLKNDIDAEELLGAVLELNGKKYTMDEDRASFIQVYLDDVRRRIGNGVMLVEQRLDLQPYFGEGQFGTGDLIGLVTEYTPEDLNPVNVLLVEDLKYGAGVRVNAYKLAQGLCYALGALELAELYGFEPDTIRIVVCQPRVADGITEWDCTPAELREFAKIAQDAIQAAESAMIHAEPPLASLSPSDKACQWCKAKARCPALAEFVKNETRSDFETIEVDPPKQPGNHEELSRAFAATELIDQWSAAVKADVWRRVSINETVMGSDGQPMKIVEGTPGKRQWENEEHAEALLLGQLSPDKLYTKKLITAPAAAKLLDKKATKALWSEIFEPMIKKAPGKPKLARGSDPKPAFSGAAAAGDFEEIEAEE